MRSKKPGHKSGKNPFYGTAVFLKCFSTDPPKPHPKIPKTHHSTAFWCWHSRKFSKMKIFISPIFSKFFFRYMPGFLRSHRSRIIINMNRMKFLISHYCDLRKIVVSTVEQSWPSCMIISIRSLPNSKFIQNITK